MKKKIWVMILTAVLLLNLLPVMTPEASADDTSSVVIKTTCHKCENYGDCQVMWFLPTPISSTPDPVFHWAHLKCKHCDYEFEMSAGPNDYGGIFKHTGGTETPTCTTGKTCELCGAQYGILDHIWSEWQSNNGGNTHTRTCQREGCDAAETGNCRSSTAHCGDVSTCDVCGGTYRHADHNWDTTNRASDANTHWFPCLYCDARLDEGDHYFVQGTMDSCLKSPATCVSRAVYYENCAYCYYKGTGTYEYPYGSVDPKNHTGNEEIRDAVEATCTAAGYTGDTYCKDCDALLTSGTAIPATGHVGGTEVRDALEATCTQDGYTGDTYCKDCDALLTSGTAIPATGHTGGTATCYWKATCEVCGQAYGSLATRNHIAGCKPEWIVTETQHEQKYSRCGRIATLKGEHTFGDWTVTQEAAPGEAGEQERVCTVCGYAETEEIPALEIKEEPAPAPTAEPKPAAEPTAEPAAEPEEEAPTSSAWWIIALIVAAGVGTGIVVRRKEKE